MSAPPTDTYFVGINELSAAAGLYYSGTKNNFFLFALVFRRVGYSFCSSTRQYGYSHCIQDGEMKGQTVM
jgi:hypothetical protein